MARGIQRGVEQTCDRVLQAFVRDDDGVLRQERDPVHVRRPDRVFQERRAELCYRLPLLHVEEHHLQLSHTSPALGLLISS